MNDAEQKRLFTPYYPVEGASGVFQGYGFGVSTTARNTKAVSHSGSDGSFFTSYSKYVDEGYSVFIYTNTHIGPAFAPIQSKLKELLFSAHL